MITPIQATISGYYGTPCSLFSAYDDEAQILLVSVEGSYRRDRREGCLVLTNERDIARDTLFGEEHLDQAIQDYFFFAQSMSADGSSQRLMFSEKATRSDPRQAIEKDAMTDKGYKYRILDSINCLQIATLATCWQVMRLINSIKTVAMFDEISDLESELKRGEIFTI